VDEEGGRRKWGEGRREDVFWVMRDEG